MIDRVMIMKRREKIIRGLKYSAISGFAIFCVTCPDVTKNAVSQAIWRCLETVIPSLYIMMTVSAILIQSNILDSLPKCTGKIIPIFLFSAIAGYPVGVKMLSAEFQRGGLSKRSAEILCGVCFGAGPAFISGCISENLYSSKAVGRVVFLSCLLANTVPALLIIPFVLKLEKNRGRSTPAKVKINSEILGSCVVSSGKSMLTICAMILFFSAISAFLSETGVMTLTENFLCKYMGVPKEICTQIISSVLDVTCVGNFPKGDYSLLPFISGLVSFGGICVLFQLSGVSDGKLNLLPCFVTRVVCGFLSGFFCKVTMPLFISRETVAVSVDFSLHKSQSVVPSIMLIIMTVLLIYGSSGVSETPQK